VGVENAEGVVQLLRKRDKWSRSGWKKAACPYKLAGVAHLSMPKAMCESGIRGGGKTWGGKWVKGVLWGAKYHLAYFVVLLPLFLGLKWTGVCAFRAEK